MNEPVQTPLPQAHPFRPTWFLIAVLIGLCGIEAVRSFVWTDIIPWRHDFTAAAAEAQQHHALRLLYFSSDYCDPCEQMRHTTWADRRVATALSQYVPVKIDFLNQRPLDHQFGVDGIPSFIVVDSENHVLKATTGGMDADEFLQWLNGRPSVAGLQ